METIIESCESLDYSWLPPEIDNFKLVVTGPNAINDIKQGIANGEKPLILPLFHYENDLGWRWSALYDKEVEDYTVHVDMPLFSFVDISFVRPTLEAYWEGLKARCVEGLQHMLVNPSQNFTYTYKRKGLPTWDFTSYLPAELEGFICDITPHTAIRMINGSYIVAEYRKVGECTGLLVYYNEFRDEFFAELRYQNYPEIDHHLDAKTIEELEAVLTTYLHQILRDLNERA